MSMLIGNKTQVGIAVPQTFLDGPVDPSISGCSYHKIPPATVQL
ncbi:MAG: hypothetical protein V3U79_12470 [Dehalococcoidia bacterium]